jgi:SAM-dependent methyltransferase
MGSRIARWKEALSSMHPASWLWALMHHNPTPHRFDILYKLGGGDPWRTENAPYEERKRADLLSLLKPRYRSILDAGCGTGVLTRLLAQHGPVLGLDGSMVAIQHADEHIMEGVTYRTGDLRTAELGGPHDLVVASEVLYYLKPEERRDVIERLAGALEPGGHFVVAGAKGDNRVIPLLESRTDLRLAGEVCRDEDVWRPYRIALFEVKRP